MRLRTLKQWLKEPLLHFILIGAGLFGLYGLVNPEAMQGRDTIIVGQDRIGLLKTRFERTWSRSPSNEELNALIDNFVIEEIFYRQALSMGLDVNDVVIRRRLRQKMELLMDASRDVLMPGDDELVAYMMDHRRQFERPDAFNFEQIFLSTDVSQASLKQRIQNIEQQLSEGGRVQGSLSMLPRQFEQATVMQIDRLFGQGFAEQIENLPLNQWRGPLRSGMGLHFVRVSQYTPAVLPDLAEIRTHVVREWQNAKSAQLKTVMLERLKDGYTIIIEAEREQRI